MKILAIERDLPAATDEAFRPHLKAEAFRAWELVQAGVFREMYFVRDEYLAVIVLECDSPEDAREALATLPLVQAGLIEFTVLPLIPYNGFERLFSA